MPVQLKTELVRIEIPGLVLREYREADVSDLLTAFADPDIRRWNPGPEGPEAAEEFSRARNDWTSGEHASWAVADASDRLVGSVSLHRIEADQADAEMGYWIAPWARGQGVATRSAGAAVRFAFDTLEMHRVYLYHAVENQGSCGVARSVGFVHEGTMRESYRYADGIYHDEHVHGMLRGDLSPAN